MANKELVKAGLSLIANIAIMISTTKSAEKRGEKIVESIFKIKDNIKKV